MMVCAIGRDIEALLYNIGLLEIVLCKWLTVAGASSASGGYINDLPMLVCIVQSQNRKLS